MSGRGCWTLLLVLLGCALVLLGCAPQDGLAPLRVCALYPVPGSSDDSLAQQVRDGVLEARAGAAFVFEEHTPADADEARSLLDTALEPAQGRRLVITMGASYAALLDERGCGLHGAQVLQLEGKPSPCEYLRSVQLETFTPGFLAGVLALSNESLAPRRSAGVVTADPTPEIDALVDGFVAGAAHAGGSAEALEIQSFEPTKADDPDATRGQVEALAAQVDVLLVAGSSESDLILDAVRAHNAERPDRPLRVIGLDQDVSVLDADLSLGAIFRQYHLEVRSSILAAVVDAFSPGQVTRGFRDGQSGLLINPVYGDASLQPRVSAACGGCATLADSVQAAVPAAEAAQQMRAQLAARDVREPAHTIARQARSGSQRSR